jgi:hypothetical protein
VRAIRTQVYTAYDYDAKKVGLAYSSVGAVADDDAWQRAPTAAPSEAPTLQPTLRPSHGPSEESTARPTHVPTAAPSEAPTLQPTLRPSFKTDDGGG